MNRVAVADPTTTPAIPAADREAAVRYISEIARRDPLAFLGPDYEAERSSELWDRFVEIYASVSAGPYARHGHDAVRIALGRL